MSNTLSEQCRRAVIAQYSSFVLAVVRSPVLELTPRQTALLLIVARPRVKGERFTVRGLAKTLNVSKPVVSRAVDALEAANLAVRQPDPEDGRSVLIAPGARAKAYIAGLAKALAA